MTGHRSSRDTLARPTTRPPCGRRRGEGGLSLAELMVSIAISSMTRAVVVTVIVGTVRTTRYLDGEAASSADVRLAAEAVTRLLSTAARPAGEASALLQATGTGVTFYTLINRSGSAQTADTVPTLVTYSYDGSCLNESRIPGARATGGGPHAFVWTAPSTTRCLLRTTVAPVFDYYSSPQLSLGGTDIAPIALPPGGSTDLAQLNGVQGVQITLTARPDEGGVGAAREVSATVVLRATLQNVVNGAVAL